MANRSNPHTMKGNTETVHPSFGLIRAGRISSSHPIKLFDSVHGHRDAMSIEITGARRIRNEDTHTTSIYQEEQHIEILMSEAQFAHFISSPNTRTGTPCTIQYIGRNKVEECPVDDTHKNYKKELHQDMTDILTTVERNLQRVEELNSKKSPLNKDEKQELYDMMYFLRQELRSNIPFLTQRLQEDMNKVVEQAKTDIEAHVSNVIQQMGMENMKTQIEGRLDALPDYSVETEATKI